MSHISIDLLDLYKTYFGKPYVINEAYSDMARDERIIGAGITTAFGLKICEVDFAGREVYLPVKLVDDTLNAIQIDCATIRITQKNTIIKTAVSERQGTIKEQYCVNDTQFTIKGVLVGTNRELPDNDIWRLKNMATNIVPVYLYNALAELFMPGDNKIAIESLEFPEQEGRHIRFRPFVMVCETDTIDTLEFTD